MEILDLKRKHPAVAMALLAGLCLTGCDEPSRPSIPPPVPSPEEKQSAAPADTAKPASAKAQAPEDDEEARAAWEQLIGALKPPEPPETWKTHPPSQEEYRAWVGTNGEDAAAAADKAREFHQNWPDLSQAQIARDIEFQFLQMAVKFGQTNKLERLREVENALLSREDLGEDRRFEIRFNAAQRSATLKESHGTDAMMEELRRQTLALQEEFPDKAKVYDLLQIVAENSPPAEGIKLANEILQGPATAETRDRAQALIADRELDLEAMRLRRRLTAANAPSDDLLADIDQFTREHPEKESGYKLLLEAARAAPTDQALSLARRLRKSPAPEETREAARWILLRHSPVGQSLPVEFIAHDGRRVNLEALTDFVVLLYFWDSAQEASRTRLPALLQVEKSFYDEGFRIIGISLDRDGSALRETLKREKILWAQSVAEPGESNPTASRLGITETPVAWLLDKKGVIRHTNALVDTPAKVRNLLAE